MSNTIESCFSSVFTEMQVEGERKRDNADARTDRVAGIGSPEFREIYARIDPRTAGGFAGFVAGLVSFRTGGAVSFESVVQQLFSLYKKLQGVSGLAAIRSSFDQFNASAQAANEQFKSTQLSSGLTIAFSAFGVGLGGVYVGRYVKDRVKDWLPDGMFGKASGKPTSALYAQDKSDTPANPNAVIKELLNPGRNEPISSRRSSMDLDREIKRRESFDQDETTSLFDLPTSSSSPKAANPQQQKDPSQHSADASGNPTAVPGKDPTAVVAGDASSSKKHFSNEEVLQIVNGVIMYLFPSLGQAVGSLAGAPNQQASDLFKAVSEQFAANRSLAEKAEDAAMQGMSSVAQAWTQSPN